MIDRLKQQMGTRLTSRQYGAVAGFVAALSCTTIFSIAKASRLMGLDRALTEDVLNALTAISTLRRARAVRCPMCGKFLEEVEADDDFHMETYCFDCGNDVEISAKDITIVYALKG
jgi:phage FluMu protein Com